MLAEGVLTTLPFADRDRDYIIADDNLGAGPKILTRIKATGVVQSLPPAPTDPRP